MLFLEIILDIFTITESAKKIAKEAQRYLKNAAIPTIKTEVFSIVFETKKDQKHHEW
jgi:hypothetical protein